VRFSEDSLHALKAQADILALVEEHVQLRRSGTRYKGLCPFHNERTPSFTVNVEMGQWYCFGCNLGGDIISFYEHLYSTDFVSAVESLSERTGIGVTRVSDDGGELGERNRIPRRRLVAALTTAATWYAHQLQTPAAAPVRDYLHSRGFNEQTIETWGLGFSPDRTAVVMHMREAGFTDEELLATDIAFAAKHNGQLVDHLAQRVLFPIKDHTGTVVGFGGRTVPGVGPSRQDRPKYLNTRETSLYRKSKMLYGLHAAVRDLRRAQQAIIVEGYTDVISLHQRGITATVATCGTALTREHVQLLTRLGATQATFAFDGDSAGRNAAERAFAVAAGTDLALRALPLPAGQDPTDWAETVGTAQVEQQLGEAPAAARWLLRTAINEHDLGSPEGRRAATKAAIQILGLIEDRVVRTEYLSYATDEGLAYDLLHAVAHEHNVAIGPTRASPRTPTEPVAVDTQLHRMRTQLEADVLWIALHQPEYLPDLWWESTADDFQHPKTREMFKAIDTAGGVGMPFDDVLKAAATSEDEGLLRRLLLRDGPQNTSALMADQAVRSLLLPGIDRKLDALRAQLADTESEHHEIFAAIQELTRRRQFLVEDHPASIPES